MTETQAAQARQAEGGQAPEFDAIVVGAGERLGRPPARGHLLQSVVTGLRRDM